MDSKWNNSEHENNEGKEKTQQTIEDLLRRWRDKEVLKNTNKVNCEKCGEKREVEKNLVVLEGPAILIIQLKRYLRIESSTIPKTVKIEQKISWSKILDLQRLPSWGVKGTYQKYRQNHK